MNLITQEEKRWEVWQYLIDENGKKVIKFFSAGLDSGNSIWVDEFREGEKIIDEDEMYETYFIEGIEKKFKDKKLWRL